MPRIDLGEGLSFTPQHREAFAWAAGFFDGEGYVGVVKVRSKGRRAMRIVLSIAQAGDRRVLDRFHQIVNVGSITGPHQAGPTNKRPYWQFAVGSFVRIQHIACLLWSWLSPVKRQQFSQALRTASVYHQQERLRPKNARLTIEQVREIKSAHGRPVDLAKQYGVKPNQISRIRLGQRWAHA